MGLESKEERVLELFLNESSKHWHFEEIVKKAKVSRSKANKWLSNLVNEGIIQHIWPKGKMPYFQAIFDSPAYRNRKRLYALMRLHKSGFLNHLLSLQRARLVILFGSFSRADWYTGSDIDIFIYGSDEGLKQDVYERELGREIQVFTAADKKELGKFAHGLLQNVINGYRIKGDLEDLAHANAPIQNKQGNL